MASASRKITLKRFSNYSKGCMDGANLAEAQELA
jgi:hypothetical protein